MAIEIKMPALSPTMTTGTLAKWLVGEGESVNSGDVIAEIETDKATMEVESVDDGIVAKIFVDAGAENVTVGAVIAVLAEDGIRDRSPSRGLGDVYKRQDSTSIVALSVSISAITSPELTWSPLSLIHI